MTAERAAAYPSATRYQTAERAASIESAVLTATERLLAQGASFAALTTQRVAEEAGVARSTLYLYFKRKNALLVGLTADLKTGSHVLMSSWSPEVPDALDRLTDTLIEVIRYYRRRGHILRAVLEVAGTDSAVGRLWNELGPFERLGQSWIEAAQAAGLTSAEIDAATASQVIVYGGIRVITQQALYGTPDRDTRVARELAANQWFGAYRRSE
jgi:AcrR family transcriptional regulator